MRGNCRIRVFSMNDYSTQFEQQNDFFGEKNRPTSTRNDDVITFLRGNYIEKIFSPKCPLINLRKVVKFHVKQKTR